MGRIVKRGDTYYAHYYTFAKGADGKTQREFMRVSTGCSDPRAAQQRLAELEREGTDPHRPKSKWRVAEAAEWYLANAVFRSPATRKMREQKLANVVRLLGHLDLHTLAKRDLIGYVSERRQERRHPSVDEPVTAHTCVKELVSFSQLLKLAQDHSLWEGDPRALLPRLSADYTPRETWLDPDQYHRFRSELQNDRDRLWCDIAVYTMGRYSEVSKLAWTDFNWPHALHLRGTKTKKADRWIPLHASLRDILAPLKRDSGLVVGSWRNCYRALRVASEFAGTPVITPNDLRRTGISLMIQQGANMKAVADIAGHANTTMIERVYAQMNMATKTAAMDKMPSMAQAEKPKVQEQTVTVSRWSNLEVD